MIPRILHQSWKSLEIPEKWRSCHQSLRDTNPGWDLRLWTDDDNRVLVRDHYPRYLEVYDALPYVIQKADFVRPLYLHLHGGFYADLDVEGLKPIDSIFTTDWPEALLFRRSSGPPAVVLGREHHRASEPKCCNAFMGSEPGHPFWLLLLDRILMACARKRGPFESKLEYVISTTGPDMLEEALHLYLVTGATDVLVAFPPLFFAQKDWEDPATANLEHAVVVHRYSGSWLPRFSGLERLVGQHLTTGRSR